VAAEEPSQSVFSGGFGGSILIGWHLRVNPWISHDFPMNIPWLFN
jgi:hypothetical protein